MRHKDNAEQLFPLDRYEYIERVAVFRTHQRKKNGKVIKVVRNDLEDIAANHNGLFQRYQQCAPFSDGHTLDGDVLEKYQPDCIGRAIRFFVERDTEGEPDDYILYSTWVLPKEDKHKLKQVVSLSPEYYPSTKRLWPISALKATAPELMEMPAVPFRYRVSESTSKYKYAVDEPSYRLTMPPMGKIDTFVDYDYISAINNALNPK